MNDKQSWQFTCKICDGHKLTVTHVWSILAGPDSESWHEWRPLEADHLWHHDFREKVEKEEDEEDEDNEDDEVERLHLKSAISLRHYVRLTQSVLRLRLGRASSLRRCITLNYLPIYQFNL